MIIDRELKQKIVAHAQEQYPKEACGFIMGDDFVAVDNVHAKPESSFAVEEGVFQQFAPECKAFVHSHPDWYPCPSEKDMAQQIATAIPWGLIGITKDVSTKMVFFGDMLDIPDLKNRPFIHGVTDCYSAIRHERFLRTGHWIPDIPRSWEWWSKGQDLYRDNFEKAGYKIVSDADITKYGPQVGDVFLATLGRSKTLNHGGVYVGNGLGLHHVTSMKPIDETRLCKEEPIERYRQYINMWVRYVEEDTPVR